MRNLMNAVKDDGKGNGDAVAKDALRAVVAIGLFLVLRAKHNRLAPHEGDAAKIADEAITSASEFADKLTAI